MGSKFIYCYNLLNIIQTGENAVWRRGGREGGGPGAQEGGGPGGSAHTGQHHQEQQSQVRTPTFNL